MSEFWVSNKKYFCKYCNIYIADDKPSRQQHEGGLRHKGNVERFIRGLYKAGEKRKQDLEEEKREMARIERAAQAAHAQDVGAGLVKPGSSSSAAGPSKPAAVPKPAKTSSDPYANYSTAASLGYTDPDAERARIEAEWRQKEGTVGTWEVVEVAEQKAPEVEPEVPVEPEAGPSRKREAEMHDEEDGRSFKLRKKTASIGLGELYDPGLIPIKMKAKKEEITEVPVSVINAPGSTPSSTTDATATASTSKPKWSTRGWNKPGETRSNTGTDTQETQEVPPEPSADDVKKEGDSSSSPPDFKPEQEVKIEADAPAMSEESAAPVHAISGGNMFRKRKIPAGGAGSRGRR